jgi:hypothetical protein
LAAEPGSQLSSFLLAEDVVEDEHDGEDVQQRLDFAAAAGELNGKETAGPA